MSKPRPGKSPTKKVKPRHPAATAGARSFGHASIPGDVASFPILEARAPAADVWPATGCGTAAIVRSRPDGTRVEVVFKLDLRSGISVATGKADLGPQEVGILQGAADTLPPSEAVPVERVAEFVWGAYAFNERDGDILPGVERFLVAVPRPPGGPERWLQRYVGPGGLTPEPLVELVRGLPEEGYTDKMEPMVETAMTFEVASPTRALELLQEHAPDFVLTGTRGARSSFDWTREYPRGHWSPLALLGGRQRLGDVAVEDHELVARADALSMAARLAGVLKEMLGADLRLRAVRWRDPTHDIERSAVL